MREQERQPLLHSAVSQDADADLTTCIVAVHDQDLTDPLTWSKKYKWSSVALLCMSGAMVTFTCIGIVPVAGDVVEDLSGHKDRSATVIFVTIWELGEAMGPLFFAPLSELYGRFIVYSVANCLFILGIVTTALSQSVGLLVFARFATGCAVASNVLNPAIIADMFPSESRGAAMSAVMLAPLIGGALGPTISGAVAEATNWRNVMWLCAAIACVVELCFLILFRETYRPAILRQHAAKKLKATGDKLHAAGQETLDQSTTSKILQSMARPARIAWSSSLLQCLSLWYGVMFAFIYVNSTSLPDILEVVYGFSPSQRGRSYLAWTLGSVVGISTCNRSLDAVFNKLAKRHKRFYPEGRLPLLIVGAFILPLAIFLYGWAAELHKNVFLFLSTVTILCVAVIFSIVPTMTYVADAFAEYSASAMTTLLVSRCLMGAFLPLAVPPLADRLGNGWTFTAMAAITLFLAPIPCLVMRYGPVWRQRSEYTRDR